LLCFITFAAMSSIAAEELIYPGHDNNIQGSHIRLTPKEKAWLENNRTIRVAVKSGWMPIEFKLESEQHRGLSIDYLTKIANLLQIKFVVVEYSDDSDLQQFDMISGVAGNSLKTSQFHIVNQPFLVVPFVIYTNKLIRKDKELSSLDDLKFKRVAVFKNGTLGRKIHENYPDIKIVYVDIADEALESLRLGLVDAYVGNEIIVDYHTLVHRMSFVEKNAPTPFTSSISMAVRNDHPELASILEKSISVIGQNNQELLDNWRIAEGKNDTRLLVLLAVIVAIFALVLYKLYRLSQKIKRQKAESQLHIWQQANFDHLTKLPNRHLLQNRLEQAISRADRSHLPLAILFIDLDDFKHVNDTSGHSIGDKLLKEAADRITQCVRQEDTVARLGGDEFMIVMSDIKDVFSLEKTCQKILNALEQPFQINGDVFFISASIGVTLYPENGRNQEDLLSHADQAMYESKKLGKNRYQFFTESIQSASLKRMSMSKDLRDALGKEQFVLYYQPIVNLQNSRIFKAEALVRWLHPTKGMIEPVEFIQIAEETGLIHELGQWVFNQTLRDLPLISQSFGGQFQLSVNVSPDQFQHPGNLLQWIDTIKSSGIPGDCISLEITERLLLEPSSAVINTIQQLRAIGVELVIDDFGTGYSALVYLKKFNIDSVKIDKSFIQNLETDNYDAVLCEAIIDMAHKLKIKVVAEGIETILQKNLLRDFKCDYGQGYLFARPQPLDEFLILLNSRRKFKKP